MNVLVQTEEMTREEWLAWRNQGLGGSDAAAACGLSRWKSPMALWLEKTGQLEPKEAGEAAYWGTLMEPLIRDEFTRRSDLVVRQEKTILQHPEHPFMLANVDGILVDPVHGEGIFEAKTTNAFSAPSWEDGIPDEYALQIQHYLAVTGLTFAYVAVVIGGNQFKWKYIPRDEDIITLLVRLETHFWQLVESNSPPPFDGSPASKELLNRLYPEGKKGAAVELPLEALALIEEFEQAKAEEYEAIYRKDEAGNKLKELLGNAEVGSVNGRVVSWKTITSERFNSKRLKAEQPEILKEYLETSVSRRFTIK